MSVDVTVKLPQIDALIKTMQDNGAMSTLLVGAGQVVAGEVKKRWLNGTGADTTVFEGGNREYLLRKGISGRQPVINMNYSGRMAKSFGVKEVNAERAVLSFSSDQLPKARGNYKLRNNMLDVDEPGIISLAVNAFNKLFRKAGKL